MSRWRRGALVEIDIVLDGAGRGPLAELAPLLDTPLPPSTLLLRLKGGLSLMPSNGIGAEAYAALCCATSATGAEGAPKLQELSAPCGSSRLLCSLQATPSPAHLPWRSRPLPRRHDCGAGNIRWSEGLGRRRHSTAWHQEEAIDHNWRRREEPEGPDDPSPRVDGSWQTVLVKHRARAAARRSSRRSTRTRRATRAWWTGWSALTPLVCLEGTCRALLDEPSEPMLCDGPPAAQRPPPLLLHPAERREEKG